MKNYKIQILLATYNGEKYISQQLDSIIAQTYPNWEVFISDDGSTDRTMSIVRDYCDKDHRIHFVNEDLEGQGACQNFGKMLHTTLNFEWDFVMFADQDDFWYDDKVQLTLNSMLKSEDFNKRPRLVYTDFMYADEQLEPLPKETVKNTSRWKEPCLSRMLVQNNIYGCTMMINRILVEKAIPMPICAENHDYWIALVAASTGEIVHVKERTMLYRQHSNNVSGHYTNNNFKKRFLRYFRKNRKLENIMCGRFKMAEEISNIFCEEMPKASLEMLLGYSGLQKMNRFRRISFCLKNKIEKDSLLQNLAFYFSLIRL